MDQSPHSDLVIPEKSVLLHIGAPKTGSTAIQHAAATQRPKLRELGVHYPGSDLHHQRGTSYLIGRSSNAWDRKDAESEWWDQLKEQVDAQPDMRRFVSFELICQADYDAVVKVRESFDQPLHAVMVVRNFASLLPSMWQQKVKMGNVFGLDKFMKDALEDTSAVYMAYNEAFHRADGRGLAERWAEVLGPENVTVVVLDPRERSQLFDAFEGLLALPSGTFAAAPATGRQSNRGMTIPEASLALELNRQLFRTHNVDKKDHRRLVWMGSVDRMLAERTPDPSEGKVGIPEWAVEPCQEAGELLAQNIRDSGVRVVGDLGALSTPGKPADHLPDSLPDQLPADLTMESILGVISAATGRGPFFGKKNG